MCLRSDFVLEYAIRRVLVSQDGLKLNGTHQLLAYADVNMLGGNVHSIQKNAEALVIASKESGLEVNADETKSRDQNAGRSHSIKIDNSSFERVEEFIYLGTALANQNSIQEEIKSRLKSLNACSHSVRNLLCSSLLSKELEIKIYRNIIMPVLCRYETWSLTLREERRVRVFENGVLRRIFGPKRDEVTGEWSKLHNEELSDMYSPPNVVRVIKSRKMRWAGHLARIGERRGVYRILVGKPGGKGPIGRPRHRWEDNIKVGLQEVGCGVWNGSSWLRIGTGGGHLWMR